MSGASSGDRRLGSIALGALWFAASVSLAEIATGALYADAGMGLGLLSSFAGHSVGALFFFGAGWISWKRELPAIAVCEGAFGKGGPALFGLLNVVQLIGWTAVMIVVGARSMAGIVPSGGPFGGEPFWRVALGALVFLWAALGPGGIGKLNTIAALALGALCLVLSAAVFAPFLSGTAAISPVQRAPFPFGAGFELAVIMPLSWLPLVGDYVYRAKRGRRAIATSAVSYSVGSVWMYALGMGAVIAFGSDDPVALLKGPWTIAALGIVLLSTVTTAFLDARSAGISLKTAAPRIPERVAVALAALAGAVLALFAPVERYESFLLLIGSVFAPLFAVLFTDFFVRGERFEVSGRRIAAFVCWGLGVAAYFALGSHSTPVGVTVPVMALVAGAYSIYLIGVRHGIARKA